MRNLLFTLGLLTSLLSYSSVTSTLVTHMGQPAFEFEVVDPAYMPAFYPDIFGTYPPDGWSYFWQTDEGAISHDEKPIFFFQTEGSHIVSVVFVPRKKEKDIGTVSIAHSFNVNPGESSGNSNGDIKDDPIYFLTPPRTGDTLFVVVPLNSCDMLSMPHTNSVVFDDTKIVLVGGLEINSSVSGAVSAHTDEAMGQPTNMKLDFVTNYSSYRTDMAAVLKFMVLAQPGDLVAVKHIPDTRFPNQCKRESEVLDGVIIGPYDPNYKESTINEINVTVTDSSIASSTSVEYTIHFQNIGTGPVDSITVVDSLPMHLTFDSYLSSSLPAAKVSFSQSGNVLTWILAPDADIKGTSESPSQPEYKTKGWVKFRAMIAPEQDITYDTCYCLCNRATIYFDSLAPITTKADVIAIGDQLCFSEIDPDKQLGTYANNMCYDSANFYGNKTLGMGDFWKTSNASPLQAYPNPTTGKIQFDIEQHGKLQISVTNIYGQTLLKTESYEQTLDISNLPVGSYLIRISAEDKSYIARVIRY